MKRVVLLSFALATLGACKVGLWTWSSDSGSRELAFPPSAAQPTQAPEPTPLSRY